MSDTPVDEAECGNCRFWRSADADEGWGSCKRHAPHPVVGKQVVEWINVPGGPPDIEQEPWWPRTYFESWCGEHSANAQ